MLLFNYPEASRTHGKNSVKHKMCIAVFSTTSVHKFFTVLSM